MSTAELQVLRKQTYVAHRSYIEALYAYIDCHGTPDQLQHAEQVYAAAGQVLDASLTALVAYLVSTHPKAPWPGELERASRMQKSLHRELRLVKNERTIHHER